MYLSCVSRIGDKLCSNFRYSTWSNMFSKIPCMPWYRFGFQASIRAPTSRDLIYQDDMFQISPGSPPGGIPLTSKPSWCKHHPTLSKSEVDGTFTRIILLMVQKSQIMVYLSPPSSFLYKMGGVVRKIKWISTWFYTTKWGAQPHLVNWKGDVYLPYHLMQDFFHQQ